MKMKLVMKCILISSFLSAPLYCCGNQDNSEVRFNFMNKTDYTLIIDQGNVQSTISPHENKYFDFTPDLSEMYLTTRDIPRPDACEIWVDFTVHPPSLMAVTVITDGVFACLHYEGSSTVEIVDL